MITLSNPAIPFSTLLATYDAMASAFEAVHMARIMAADHGLNPSEAFRDHEGRTIVDALPDVDAYDAEPVTLRCYGVAA